MSLCMHYLSLNSCSLFTATVLQQVAPGLPGEWYTKKKNPKMPPCLQEQRFLFKDTVHQKKTYIHPNYLVAFLPTHQPTPGTHAAPLATSG